MRLPERFPFAVILLFLVQPLLQIQVTVVRHIVGKEDGTFYDSVGSRANDPALIKEVCVAPDGFSITSCPHVK